MTFNSEQKYSLVQRKYSEIKRGEEMLHIHSESVKTSGDVKPLQEELRPS